MIQNAGNGKFWNKIAIQSNPIQKARKTSLNSRRTPKAKVFTEHWYTTKPDININRTQ